MSVSISSQGAQVYRWNHIKFGEILWVSEAAIFQKGKSIRGGIPICWPWFGPKEGYPQHGFCRILEWEKVEESSDQFGNERLKYQLNSNEITQAYFAYKFQLILEITYGQEMKVSLTTTNLDDVSFKITEALHTYFLISDIEQISISGLQNCSYYDKVKNQIYKSNKQDISIDGEIDHVYENQSEVTIIDPILNRKILISQLNAKNTVVWNPGIEKAMNINDMKTDEFKNFICVETANALKNEITIESGTSHTITQIIKVEKYL